MKKIIRATTTETHYASQESDFIDYIIKESYGEDMKFLDKEYHTFEYRTEGDHVTSIEKVEFSNNENKNHKTIRKYNDNMVMLYLITKRDGKKCLTEEYAVINDKTCLMKRSHTSDGKLGITSIIKCKYNSLGNITYKSSKNILKSHAIINHTKYIYKYDNCDRLCDVIINNGERYKMSYHDNGVIREILQFSKNGILVKKCNYNEYGYIILFSRFRADCTDGVVTRHYKYDIDMVKESYNEGCVKHNDKLFRYQFDMFDLPDDVIKCPISVRLSHMYITKINETYSSCVTTSSSDSIYSYKYHESNGHMTMYYDGCDGFRPSTWIFDGKGNIIKFTSSGLTETIEYSYESEYTDEPTSIVNKKFNNDIGGPDTETIFEYDELGRVILEKHIYTYESK